MMPSQAPEVHDFPALVAKILAAFMGSAIGDALGWPNERRDHVRSSAKPIAAEDITAFRPWTKRAGGRFQPHIEEIAAGDYSDDTQLILALTRSLIGAKLWWRDFAQVELPLWTVYERGGGAAMERSAQGWAQGTAPWAASAEDRAKYFQAGGNGAAMRILPLVAFALTQQNPDPLATLCAAASVSTPRTSSGAAGRRVVRIRVESRVHAFRHARLWDARRSHVGFEACLGRVARPDVLLG